MKREKAIFIVLLKKYQKWFRSLKPKGLPYSQSVFSTFVPHIFSRSRFEECWGIVDPRDSCYEIIYNKFVVHGLVELPLPTFTVPIRDDYEPQKKKGSISIYMEPIGDALMRYIHIAILLLHQTRPRKV